MTNRSPVTRNDVVNEEVDQLLAGAWKGCITALPLKDAGLVGRRMRWAAVALLVLVGTGCGDDHVVPEDDGTTLEEEVRSSGSGSASSFRCG